MVIFIGVPTPEYQHYFFTSSLLALITHSMNTLKNANIIYQPQTGVRTDRNRNMLLEQAYKTNFDYILWLDADMTYPKDIIIKYLEAKEIVNWQIIGSLYFKRKPPFDPVAYFEKGSKEGKYHALHPESIKNTDIMKVLALGYGGMMVSRQAYDAMDEDKWTRYGHNFYHPQPHDNEYQTHDILFCEKAREHGIDVYLHGGVRPKHLHVVEIGYDDWKREHEKPQYDETITVIMPTIHPTKAKKVGTILKKRSGMPANYRIIKDIDKDGYVTLINNELKFTNSRYIAYVTDDIFPSRNWLKDAFDLMKQNEAGLVGFNDGKWKGMLATCGLVDRKWSDTLYNGNIFYPDYFGHYNDTELTLFAMAHHKYAYDPNISLVEVDFDKEKKKVHEKDKQLFAKRKQNEFGGKIVNTELIQMFS